MIWLLVVVFGLFQPLMPRVLLPVVVLQLIGVRQLPTQLFEVFQLPRTAVDSRLGAPPIRF